MSIHKSPITLVVHGGAGTVLPANLSAEKEKAFKQTMAEALNAGYDLLAKGAACCEAIVEAVRIMEDSPLFNAGRGSVFTHEGTNELDAAIMRGSDLAAGAVAGVGNIKNPIEAAYKVMTQSAHVLLAGRGAEQFAAEQGIEIVNPHYFFTEERYRQLRLIVDTQQVALDHAAGNTNEMLPPEHKFGTVGCVALDLQGNIGAGTSTGGMTNKRYGRIGDTPIIGAGTYADNSTCAVSATGHGEYFMRSLAAFDIAALIRYKGLTLDEAAREVILQKLRKMGGEGGVIALNRLGEISMVFNSPGMYRGYMKEKGKLVTSIFRQE